MIINRPDPQSNKEIESAINFMIASFNKSRQTDKPVIAHSLRVGFYLDSLGYPKDLVIAALLHDILENSKITIGEIKKRFGPKVANLVEANTLDLSMPKTAARYKKFFSLAKKNGSEALLIRGADLLDNSKYYYLVKNKKLKKLLLWKYKYFLELSEDLIGKTQVFKDLKNFNRI